VRFKKAGLSTRNVDQILVMIAMGIQGFVHFVIIAMVRCMWAVELTTVQNLPPIPVAHCSGENATSGNHNMG